jgi:hypothetical protein
MTTTKSTTTHAPDESGKAIRKINEALFLDGDRITHATARLIAAAINPGPGSALEKLASTGQFDTAILRHELEQLIVAPFQQPWRDAVLGYLNGLNRTHPWTRPVIIPRERG